MRILLLLALLCAAADAFVAPVPAALPARNFRAPRRALVRRRYPRRVPARVAVHRKT